MKSLSSIKNYGLALIAMTLMLTAANAQSRYKTHPRVKIGKNETQKVDINQEKTTPVTTTAQFIQVEENNAVAVENSTPATENVTVASTSQEVVVVNHKTTSVVKHPEMIKAKKKADKQAFTDKVKNNSKLLDVKDVKKTNMETWLLIMIILYAAGLVFIILGVVFTFTLFGPLGLIFYIIGALCLIAASIVLILGLTGVM